MQNLPPPLGERVVVFVDYGSTLQALRSEGRQVDLVALRDYLNEGRHLVETFVYVPTQEAGEQALGPGAGPTDGLAANARLLERLRRHGFLAQTRPGELQPDGRLTCDFDTEIALDARDFVAQCRPDIVVFVSGSPALAPVARRLRLQGIRVEVASTPARVAPALRTAANGFVDLTGIAPEVDHLPVPEPADQAEAEPVEPDLVFEEPALP